MKPHTPFSAVGRGLTAGAVGTVFMTAWQELAAKLQSSTETNDPHAEAPPEDPWEDAPAPAKIAKRVGGGVFHKQVSPELIPTRSNAMHWAFGTGWGAVYGLAASTSARRSPGLKAGAIFGTTVWLMSYAQLVPMGIYDLPWKYPPKDLALELSSHLVYGAAWRARIAVLDGRRRP